MNIIFNPKNKNTSHPLSCILQVPPLGIEQYIFLHKPYKFIFFFSCRAGLSYYRYITFSIRFHCFKKHCLDLGSFLTSNYTVKKYSIFNCLTIKTPKLEAILKTLLEKHSCRPPSVAQALQSFVSINAMPGETFHATAAPNLNDSPASVIKLSDQ